MADLSESQASQSVKIVGANPSTGIEDNYIDVDTSGRITSKAQLQDNSGNGITSTILGSTQRLDINGVPILDTTGSGTITSGTTPNDVVVATTSGCSSVIFNVIGTWVGTMRVEGLYGDGTTWTLITATDASQSVFATTTANDRWTVACGGFSQVRLRMSSYTSGSASVVWTSSVGSGAPLNVWNTNAISLKVASNGLKASGIYSALSLTPNSDIKIVDGLRNGGVYGNLVLTTANTTYQAKVGSNPLTNRKSLTIVALDDMYWGYDSSITTSTGTPLYKNQSIIFSIDPDSTFQVWLVANANSKNARVTESP